MQSLQPFHTFNIPANAREIIEATSIEQIQQAWQKAQAENLPVLFLGQGSNMLFLAVYRVFNIQKIAITIICMLMVAKIGIS